MSLLLFAAPAMPDGRPFVFWGSAGHAKVLLDLLVARGARLVALFDNQPSTTSIASGVPLYLGWDGFQRWMQESAPVAGVSAAIAIGGSRGSDRHDIARRLVAHGLELPTLIHPMAAVSRTARWGEGCQILAQTVVAPDVVMGDVCIVNHNATVDHECELGHGVHIAPGATLCGCIRIGDNTLVGAGAVVLPRLTIGRNVVIGAGAVVTKDVADDTVVIGNPAVPIMHCV